MKNEIKNLQHELEKEQQINRILSSEIEQLKAINVGLKEAYDTMCQNHTFKGFIKRTPIGKVLIKIKRRLRG